ncbi:hypothetical protein [Ferrovibrio xuzhouensis]|uniref:Lipoprotein n=1 Tax=Ferrovibrio xuzhouensis TaxID=1576914 RepID=A0ABV7VJ88_9PROT
MRRRGLVLLVLAALAGCSGVEGGLRNLNRSLYQTWSGDDGRTGRPETATGEGADAGTPCFNAENGLMYVSQTGRCAPGYAAIALDQAERAFGGSTARAPVAGRGGPDLTPLPQQSYPPARAGTTASAAPTDRRLALCYNDSTGQIFEAEACPSGSRWIDSADAEAIQRASLSRATWCYFASRHLLYRSRACRPGDQTLSVAEADRIWDGLPADRRTRQRPSATGGPLQPVPPVDAAPRSGVNATPLPAPK